MEMWHKISNGRIVPEKLGDYINRGFKNFNGSISDIPFANALRTALFIASYGTIAAIEVVRNRNVDLPKRNFRIKHDVAPIVKRFNDKSKEFIMEPSGKQKQKLQNKPVKSIEQEREV